MKIVSLNAGVPRTVLYKGRTVKTAIFKAPVTGTARIRRHNLDGDAQADLDVHGGPSKAVYGYPSEHYDFWRSELAGLDLPWGMFGENLTTEGLSEEALGVGDTFRVGTAVLRVTEPRVPCFKLALRFDREDMVKRFLQSGRSGFYFAVVEEGDVAAGAPVEKVARDPEGISIADLARLYRSKDPELRESAELAVRYIEQARNRNLAWRYEPRGGDNDTSVTVWCVEALAAARAAGIDVDAAAWRGALAWVDSATGEFGRVGYDTRGGLPSRPEKAGERFPPERSESMTAAGILVRVLAREQPRKEDLVARGVKLIMNQPPTWVPESGTIDMYYWRCATRALRLAGSGEWPRWKGLVQPVCLRWQVPASGAHNAGSWDPVDPWGEDGGRVYATAMMTLALIESARAAE